MVEIKIFIKTKTNKQENPIIKKIFGNIKLLTIKLKFVCFFIFRYKIRIIKICNKKKTIAKIIDSDEWMLCTGIKNSAISPLNKENTKPNPNSSGFGIDAL